MLVAVLVLLLVLAVFASTIASVMGTGQMGSMLAGQSTQAFYAAQSGLEASLKEIVSNSDVDSNGTIGAIDSVSIGNATVYTTYVGSILTAYGQCGDARRVLEVTATLGGGGG